LDKDFKDIGVTINGVTYGPYKIDQHLNATQIITWMNQKPELVAAGITMEAVALPDYGRRVLSGRFM
jgi:hypothetical protein